MSLWSFFHKKHIFSVWNLIYQMNIRDPLRYLIRLKNSRPCPGGLTTIINLPYLFVKLKSHDCNFKNCFSQSTKQKRQEALFSKLPASQITGDERIELPLRVLETPVIPLDQSPMSAEHSIFIPYSALCVNCFFKKFEIIPTLKTNRAIP